MKQIHKGSCHCGAVTFEAETDLMDGTSRCNCSVCRRSRFWKAIVPASNFRLTAGADKLTQYRFASQSIVHHFCSTCGVKPFGSGDIEGIGPFYAVNVTCLELEDTQLDSLPVAMEDGRHDRWDRMPEYTDYL